MIAAQPSSASGQSSRHDGIEPYLARVMIEMINAGQDATMVDQRLLLIRAKTIRLQEESKPPSLKI